MVKIDSIKPWILVSSHALKIFLNVKLFDFCLEKAQCLFSTVGNLVSLDSRMVNFYACCLSCQDGKYLTPLSPSEYRI